MTARSAITYSLILLLFLLLVTQAAYIMPQAYQSVQIGAAANASTIYSINSTSCQEQLTILSSGNYVLSSGQNAGTSPQPCIRSLDIDAGSVSFNCSNGSIGPSKFSVSISNSSSTEIENCNIYGSAVYAANSKNITIYGSNIIASNASSTDFALYDSVVKLYGTKLYGYSSGPTINNSVLSVSNYVATQPSNSTTAQQATTSAPQAVHPNFAVGIYSKIAYFIIIFIFLCLIIAGLYSLINAHKGVPKSRRHHGT